jgi:predicted RNase H-like nuclease
MTVVGIDGCPAGWIAIISKDDEWSYGIFSSIEELVIKFSYANYYLIDMPMGLGDKHISRYLDSWLKSLLKSRHSTVFQAPCREVLAAKNYEKANRINRTILGKGLSIQTWNIMPKIRELDNFLRNNGGVKNRFYETSPELCFAGFNRCKPLLTRKSTSQGTEERISIISKAVGDSSSTILIDKILNQTRRNQVKFDDILDAFILCITAWKGAKNGFCKILNDDYSADSVGIPMRALYYIEK